MTMPKYPPIRKPNLYLGFPPVKRANPIRLVMNLRVPLRFMERFAQSLQQTIRSQITPKLVSMSVVLLIQKCLADKVFCVKI